MLELDVEDKAEAGAEAQIQSRKSRKLGKQAHGHTQKQEPTKSRRRTVEGKGNVSHFVVGVSIGMANATIWPRC